MATIVTRAVGYIGSATLTAKGTPLTNAEVDNNFINLNNAKLEISGASPTFVNVTTSGDVAVNGGDITSTASTFNLLNTPVTLNLGQAATNISIGATTGTTTFRNDVSLAKSLGVTTSAVIGTTLQVTGATTLSSTLAVTGNTTLTGDLAVNGGDITTTATTFNLLNSASTTTLNIGQSATTVSIGAFGTGNTTIGNNITIAGNAAVNGNNITTTSTTFNLLNATTTTLNFAQAAINITMGAATGTTTINNTTLAAKAITASTTLSVTGNTTLGGTLAVTGNTTLTGDLTVNGGDLISPATFNLAQAATTLSIGATTGTATIRNATTAITGNATVGGTLGVTGNTTLSTATVSGVITHGTASMAVPTGNAPIFAIRGWGRFNGLVGGTNVTGTYSQTTTTVTVTITGHGLVAGDIFYADITTGTGVDGFYTVATATANTFTYTAGTSLTTSGNIQLPRRTLTSGGNIKSVVPYNINGNSGQYAVNFTTDMPNTNYAVVGNVMNTELSPSNGSSNFVFGSFNYFVHGFLIISTDNNGDTTFNSANITFTILG